MSRLKENYCTKGDCIDFWPPWSEDDDCASRPCAQAPPVCNLTKSFELVISHLEKGSELCIPQGCIDPDYKNVINQSHSIFAMQIDTTPNVHNGQLNCVELDRLDSSYIGSGNGNISTLIEGALPLSLTDVCCLLHDIQYTIAETEEDLRAADAAVINNLNWNILVHNESWPNYLLAKNYFEGLANLGISNPAWPDVNAITDSTKESKDKIYYIQRVANALLEVQSDPGNVDFSTVTGPSQDEKRVIVDFGAFMKYYISRTGKFNFYKDFAPWLTTTQELKDAISEYTTGPKTAGGVPLIEIEHGPIESWDVSAITNMDSLFLNNTVFNGDISTWDVSNVKTMFNMFDGADSFTQNISLWDLSSLQRYDKMTVGNNGTMPCNNYCSSGQNNEAMVGSKCVHAIKTNTQETTGCDMTNGEDGLTCYCKNTTCQDWASDPLNNNDCDFGYVAHNPEATDFVLSPASEGAFRDVCCKTTCQEWADNKLNMLGQCDFGYVPNFDAANSDVYPGTEPRFKEVCCKPE